MTISSFATSHSKRHLAAALILLMLISSFINMSISAYNIHVSTEPAVREAHTVR